MVVHANLVVRNRFVPTVFTRGFYMEYQNIPQDEEPVLYQGRIFKVVERTQIGRNGKLLKRQVVKHPGAVGIVPVLPDGRVLLIKQFRITFQEYIYEIPAGTLEYKEDSLVAAKRELLEETGYKTESFQLLASIYTSPGILQEELLIYLATDLIEDKSSPEEGELIVPRPMTWFEIDNLIDSGLLHDAKSIAGLFLARHRLGIN